MKTEIKVIVKCIQCSDEKEIGARENPEGDTPICYKFCYKCGSIMIAEKVTN